MEEIQEAMKHLRSAQKKLKSISDVSPANNIDKKFTWPDACKLLKLDKKK